MKTEYLMQQYKECDDSRIFEQLIIDNDRHCKDWKKHLTLMLNSRNILKKDLISVCGRSKNTITAYTNGIPPRVTVIHMAMAMRLNLEETNELLTRWANHAKLYSRDPQDTIWIYLLQRGGSSTPIPLFDAYWKVYLDICDMVNAGKIPMPDPAAEENTQLLLADIISGSGSGWENPEDDLFFRNMMLMHLPAFEQANRMLEEHINSLFVPHVEWQLGRLTEPERNKKSSGRVLSAHKLFQDHTHFYNAYYRKMRELKKYHIVPEREFLIALGLHLALDVSQINYMLNLTGMGQLHPKNRIDGCLIFYLEDLWNRYPAMLFSNSQQMYDMNMGLANEVLVDDDDTENPQALRKNERIYEYIRRRLEGTTIFKKEDRPVLDKLLSFL